MPQPYDEQKRWMQEGEKSSRHVSTSSVSAGWWRRVLLKVPAVFGLALMIAAMVLVWREFRRFSLHDILHSLHQIPSHALWAGAGATICAYIILSFYDGLACHHVGANVSWVRSAFVAFCAYVLSHNLGCAAISGTAVRYRLYRGWGVSGGKIAGIIAFCSVTYLLGTLGLIGFVLLWQPQAVPLVSHIPLWVSYLAGIGCYLVLLAYVVLPIWKREIVFRRWRLELPDWRMGLAQILVSMADMSVTALIAWCVVGPLPADSGLTFSGFLAIYIVSYTVGLAASVPGGLGVFDSAMLLALSPWLPVPDIMGAILVFRLFYYLIPLLLAGVMFAGHELYLRGAPLLPWPWAGFSAAGFGTNKVIRESEADFSVGVAVAVQVFLGVGAIVYALIAHLPEFRSPVDAFLVQAALLLLMLSGVALLGLAVGLVQRVALAWRLSVMLHCLSLPLLFVCHASWVATVVVLVVLLMLITFRGCYYRQAYGRVAPFSPVILTPLSLWVVGLIGMGWIGHQQHLGPIWWRAMIHDANTAKGRWFLVGAALCSVVTGWCAMRRTRIRPYIWNQDTQIQYATLSGNKSPSASWGISCMPDGVVPDESGRSVLAFARMERFILALGTPVGLERCAVATVWRLRDYVEQEGCSLAVFQTTDMLADVYGDIGLSHIQLSETCHIFCDIEQYSALVGLLRRRGMINESLLPPPFVFRRRFYHRLTDDPLHDMSQASRRNLPGEG